MADSEIPESRVYRHVKCDTETTVSGQSFEVASNPMSDMARTWCTQCESHFPISDYEWSDTGETIADYYARHGSGATALQRFLCSKKFMIIMAVSGFISGAIGGFFLTRGKDLWVQLLFIPFVGFIGVFIGCAIYISGFCEPITKKVSGVKDTRMLR